MVAEQAGATQHALLLGFVGMPSIQREGTFVRTTRHYAGFKAGVIVPALSVYLEDYMMHKTWGHVQYTVCYYYPTSKAYLDQDESFSSQGGVSW